MVNKKDLVVSCIELIQVKIDRAKKGMDEAQASANNETKSSAGDKYETGRAMSQRERDLHARQLAELLNAKKTLSTINAKKTCDSVELGAMVCTTSHNFFIGVSLGELTFKNEKIMVISAISPIAQAMLGKSNGDFFDWMKKQENILSVA
jgi:transcription elongation GreA/GreB family factor